MSQLSALKSAATLSEFADLLRVQPSWLSYLLYIKPEAAKYKKFQIPKRSGGTRQICAPEGDLKFLQRLTADLLQNCVEEINKAQGRSDDDAHPDHIAHGFKRRRSIITNARRHRNRRHVFNVDIENFFGAINFGRVRGYFIADRNFLLQPRVATLIAQIACFENSLPQGSPCSPVISNLIGHILDVHLTKLSNRLGCTYTRYADDLTFSTNQRKFPDGLAVLAAGSEHTWLPGPELCHWVHKCGFAINELKTRMQYRTSRQEVTGLVVNRKVNVRSDYRRRIRAMVHRLSTTGFFHFEQRLVGEDGATVTQQIPGNPNQLRGMLGFIDAVTRAGARSTAKEVVPTDDVTYRRFLMFHEFYAAPKPVVICEGKTDNVYLTHAIRSLAGGYPTLADVKADGEISIRIRRFRYTDNSTGRILKMHGGTGDLAHFIRKYRSELFRFKAPGMRVPVILLIDNDAGANPIINVIDQITKKKPARSDSFSHVVGNLYLVLTPLIGDAQQSKIEDSFDSATTGTVLGGKKFNPENGHDTKTEYGKSDFAYKVVQPNADKISFEGFKPILDRIVQVMIKHEEKFLDAARAVSQ